MKTVKLKKVEIPPIGFHLIVEVKLNGVTTNLVLDTGASRSVIDYDFLTELNPSIDIQEEEGESAGVGSSNLASFVALVNNFEIGELSIDEIEIASLDLTHVKESYEKIGESPIHGVLGGDVLNQYQAVIDYGECVLRLND